MTAKEQLIREIEQAPEPLIEEVLNFVLFAKARRNQTVFNSDIKAESVVTQTAEASEPNNRPIWELFEEFTSDLPNEVIAQLPTDGAEQHDHYLYGVPKRQS